MKKRILRSLLAFVLLFLFVPIVNASGSEWKSAYREYISSARYNDDLRVGNPQFAETLYDRDKNWDIYTTYDMDLDGVPELLIGTEYGPEQIDVFSYVNGLIKWMGTMGGDNFFQTVVSYDGAGIRGKVYAFAGGPAMTVKEYCLSNAGLMERTVAKSLVDNEGMETVGIDMYVSDSRLEQLLRGSLIGGSDSGERLLWVRRNNLVSESDWNEVFSMARSYGTWN